MTTLTTRYETWSETRDHFTAVELLHEAMTFIGQVRTMFEEVCEAHVMNMDNGSGFTCSEAEAMFECMVGAGAVEAAKWFMIAHAGTDDDEGDQHEQVLTLSEFRPGDMEPTGWKYREGVDA